jgi:transcription-repair coupling factor (superfamily II helicase)
VSKNQKAKKNDDLAQESTPPSRKRGRKKAEVVLLNTDEIIDDDDAHNEISDSIPQQQQPTMEPQPQNTMLALQQQQLQTWQEQLQRQQQQWQQQQQQWQQQQQQQQQMFLLSMQQQQQLWEKQMKECLLGQQSSKMTACDSYAGSNASKNENLSKNETQMQTPPPDNIATPSTGSSYREHSKLHRKGIEHRKIERRAEKNVSVMVSDSTLLLQQQRDRLRVIQLARRDRHIDDLELEYILHGKNL